MNFSKKKLTALGATALLIFAFKLFAHDAWVEPGRGPVYKVLYGHKVPETYPAGKLTELKVMDANQKELKYSRIPTKKGVNIKVNEGAPALFALTFDNGYWVKVNGESKNVRLSKMPTGTDPAHPIKYSKTIMNWLPWMTKPLGQKFELVPVAIDGTPKVGSQLQLQLLLDGKPLSGQIIENNSNEEGPLTDANGMVYVTVVKGINRFANDYNIDQTTDPDAKRLSLTAVLVFEAK